MPRSCVRPPPPRFAVSQRANKRPGATFFPQKVIEELRARLGGLAAAGAASDDEYVARCVEIRDELDDELRAYRDSIDKYMELDAGVLARSMNVG